MQVHLTSKHQAVGPQSSFATPTNLQHFRSSAGVNINPSDNHHCDPKMSFDRLPSLEAQPTTTRRQDDPHYRDDPEFSQLSDSLSTRLFELTSNISRLSQQISLLGTKRDTERVRERVHDLLEETKEGFKEVGDGVKKVQGWEDLNVSTFSAEQYVGVRN